jgi:gluconolactonase
MNLQIFDERVLELLDPKAPLEKLATGYTFVEGPVWHDGVYHFPDFMVNKVYRYEKGVVTLIDDDSHFAIGQTWDRRKKRILRCSRDLRAITDSDKNIIVNNYQGTPINGSNDVIVDTKGRIFFSDPLSRKIEGPQIGHSSMFMFDEDALRLEMLETTLTYPNGLALSLDESLLYISDTNDGSLDTLSLEKRKLETFVHLDESVGGGKPDGLRLDSRGNIYTTGPGGIWIVAPSGAILGLLKMPEVAANLCFDDTGLFITASTSIYHVETKVV